MVVSAAPVAGLTTRQEETEEAPQAGLRAMRTAVKAVEERRAVAVVAGVVTFGSAEESFVTLTEKVRELPSFNVGLPAESKGYTTRTLPLSPETAERATVEEVVAVAEAETETRAVEGEVLFPSEADFVAGGAVEPDDAGKTAENAAGHPSPRQDQSYESRLALSSASVAESPGS